MLASGGNDNKVTLWDLNRLDMPHFIKAHQSAVKALAWNKMKPDILLTGGGNKDRSIKVWDIKKGELVKSIDTNS